MSTSTDIDNVIEATKEYQINLTVDQKNALKTIVTILSEYIDNLPSAINVASSATGIPTTIFSAIFARIFQHYYITLPDNIRFRKNYELDKKLRSTVSLNNVIKNNFQNSNTFSKQNSDYLLLPTYVNDDWKNDNNNNYNDIQLNKEPTTSKYSTPISIQSQQQPLTLQSTSFNKNKTLNSDRNYQSFNNQLQLSDSPNCSSGAYPKRKSSDSYKLTKDEIEKKNKQLDQNFSEVMKIKQIPTYFEVKTKMWDIISKEFNIVVDNKIMKFSNSDYIYIHQFTSEIIKYLLKGTPINVDILHNTCMSAAAATTISDNQKDDSENSIRLVDKDKNDFKQKQNEIGILTEINHEKTKDDLQTDDPKEKNFKEYYYIENEKEGYDITDTISEPTTKIIKKHNYIKSRYINDALNKKTNDYKNKSQSKPQEKMHIKNKNIKKHFDSIKSNKILQFNKQKINKKKKYISKEHKRYTTNKNISTSSEIEENEEQKDNNTFIVENTNDIPIEKESLKKNININIPIITFETTFDEMASKPLPNSSEDEDVEDKDVQKENVIDYLSINYTENINKFNNEIKKNLSRQISKTNSHVSDLSWDHVDICTSIGNSSFVNTYTLQTELNETDNSLADVIVNPLTYDDDSNLSSIDLIPFSNNNNNNNNLNTTNTRTFESTESLTKINKPSTTNENVYNDAIKYYVGNHKFRRIDDESNVISIPIENSEDITLTNKAFELDFDQIDINDEVDENRTKKLKNIYKELENVEETQSLQNVEVINNNNDESDIVINDVPDIFIPLVNQSQATNHDSLNVNDEVIGSPLVYSESSFH